MSSRATRRFTNAVTKDPTLAIAIIMLMVSSFAIGSLFFSSLGGYQSITASWHHVEWDHTWYYGLDLGRTNPQEIDLYQYLGGRSNIVWDGNEAAGVPSGLDRPDWNGITAQIENLKYDRHLDYNDWWINDTVSEENPEGTASHYEWSIDVYTCNVNWIVTDDIHWYVEVHFFAEFTNNFDSVFSGLGAEGAASYVIYAQTESYTRSPENAPHATILPTTGNFAIDFPRTGRTVSPPAPQEGSKLDFEALEPYSDVLLEFILSDFGCGAGETRPSVNMVVELNVLTVGRFDYVLTYEAGGENDIAPIGGLGIFDGIGAAIAAGWDGLLTGASIILDAATLPFVAIAVVAMSVLFIIIFLKFGGKKEKDSKIKQR